MPAYYRDITHYKYEVTREYRVRINLRGYSAHTPYVTLDTQGYLTIRPGFLWDGPTGIPDTPSIMRGSLIHDALYYLMRWGALPISCREQADCELIDICGEDGTPEILQEIMLSGTRLLAQPYAVPQHDPMSDELILMEGGTH